MHQGTFVRLLFLAAVSIFSTNPVFSASPSGGWEEVPLTAPDSSSTHWVKEILATSEELLIVSDSGKLALIDAATGSERALISPPVDLAPFSRFAVSAAFIDGRLVVISFATLSLRMDELDVTTGTWIRSTSLPGRFVGYFGKPVLFGKEIRINDTEGMTYRFTQKDWLPLAPLTYSRIDGDIPNNQVRVGDSNLSYYTNASAKKPWALLFERDDGTTFDLPLPKNHTFFGNPKFSSSPSYFVTTAWASPDGAEFLIWNARDLTHPPKILPTPSAWYSSLIWKDRYLLANGRDAFGKTWILLWDLQNLSLVPLEIDLPPYCSFSQIHASGKLLWFLDASYRRPQQNGILCKLALGDSPQAAIVAITGARANERDGLLKFKVEVTPAPLLPVTVHFATSSGTAVEDEDYQGTAGTVTLTSSKPSAEVIVPIIQDQKLENYETMKLSITAADNGWCLDPEAFGVIVSTGATEMSKTDPLPNEGTHTMGSTWVASGLAVWDYGRKQLLFCANEQRQWKTMTSLPDLSDWYHVKILPAGRDSVIVANMGTRIEDPWTFHEVDIHRNLLILSGKMPSPEIGMRVAINRDLYLTQTYLFGSPDGIELRRTTDSALVRKLIVPNESLYSTELIGGRDGISAIKGAYGTYFHHLTPDGGDSYRYSSLSGLGSIAAMGPDHVFVAADYGEIAVLFDAETGATLETLPLNAYSTDGAMIADREYGGRVKRIVIRPRVPAPLNRVFKTSESTPDHPFDVELSEAVDFPLTVSVNWCSSPADIVIAVKPITLAPGTRKLALPFSISDDHLPEGDETVTVAINILGNGFSETFDMEVSIKDNDIFEFDTKLRDKDVIRSSAMDIGAGSPIFASALYGAVADPVTKTVFRLKNPKFEEIIGHAVVANASYAIVGAPGRKGEVEGLPTSNHSSVFILNRKNKSVSKHITKSGALTGFGSVLNLRDDRVFVGAPGDKVVGSVYSYKVPSGSSEQEFKKPGKGQKGTRFGFAIANDSKFVWIGAPREGKGVVYQFNADTGKLVKKFSAPSGGISNFGHSLSICGPYVAIGSPSRTQASAVFLYKRSTGSFVGTIHTPFTEGACFGTSLATMGGTRLAIGCPEIPGSYSGSVIIHDLSSKSFPMIIMLTPSSVANKYHSERYGRIGGTGSISAHGDFLGLQFMVNSDPLSLYTGISPQDCYSEVLFIPPVGSKATTPSNAESVVIQNSPKIRSVSASSDAAVPQDLAVSLDGSKARISLPTQDFVREGTTVVLEASENLTDWTDIAAAIDGQPWISLTPDGIYNTSKREFEINTSASGRCFFRLHAVPLPR